MSNWKKKKPCQLPEIIVQILLKLPVESLLRCKSVCKSWYSLISDPQFVKSHLAMPAGNLNRHQLVFTTGPEIMKRCNLSDVFFNLSINVSDIYYSPKHIRRINVRFVGSCNGLVCINDGGFGLSISNPSTRKFNILPNCEHQFRGRFWIFIYGFGYDASTDNYKVVKLSCNLKDTTNCETFVRIYSLKDGSWKEFYGFPQGFRCYGFGKFSNGALHWSARNESQLSTILSLDLATETFREILLPPYDASDRDVKLGSLGEWLCGICIYPGIRADLWVMKDYGVKESWAKLVSIPYFRGAYPWMDLNSVPLCISNDGKYLLEFGWKKFIVYDSKNNSFSEVQNLDRYYDTCTSVESLVSPMPATSVLEIGNKCSFSLLSFSMSCHKPFVYLCLPSEDSLHKDCVVTFE
ncbi:F-box/kelch-repeat protein At3g23880-like [Bidens hawaiensis]|uniref:F-box/kelch-repeat protein At3g23880-like n=1 Tax=Bidens hawaiensis TaxID=980011 RepID=UPI004049E462